MSFTAFAAAAAKVFTGLAAPVVDVFKRRMEIAAEDRQQERAIKRAQIDRQVELIKTGLTADMNWEMEFAKQAASSWKDEYTLLVVSIPAVLCFFGKRGAAIVIDGFKALEQTPYWYQFLFISLFLATVGIRYWRKSQSDT